MNERSQLIVFFDADCLFCSRTARFLAEWDHRQVLLFASLQGKTAKERKLSHHADEQKGTLVVCRIHEDTIFLRAEAALVIGEHLSPLRWLAKALRCLPLSWLNALYRIVASNRHRLMRKASTCSLPSPAFTERLLD